LVLADGPSFSFQVFFFPLASLRDFFPSRSFVSSEGEFFDATGKGPPLLAVRFLTDTFSGEFFFFHFCCCQSPVHVRFVLSLRLFSGRSFLSHSSEAFPFSLSFEAPLCPSGPIKPVEIRCLVDLPAESLGLHAAFETFSPSPFFRQPRGRFPMGAIAFLYTSPFRIFKLTL